jgi:hypothetical protein
VNVDLGADRRVHGHFGMQAFDCHGIWCPGARTTWTNRGGVATRTIRRRLDAADTARAQKAARAESRTLAPSANDEGAARDWEVKDYWPIPVAEQVEVVSLIGDVEDDRPSGLVEPLAQTMYWVSSDSPRSMTVTMFGAPHTQDRPHSGRGGF